MINIQDLKAGETILTAYEGEEQLVLEVFTRTVVLSVNKDFISAVTSIYTIEEINKYGYKIYTEPSKVPTVDDAPTLKKVRAKYNSNTIWNYGYLVTINHKSVYPFFVLCNSKEKGVSQYPICELYEWKD